MHGGCALGIFKTGSRGLTAGDFISLLQSLVLSLHPHTQPCIWTPVLCK
ncbi:MAG: hypothetical protein ACD_5C00147G0002, partial [uncultured bacterium]